MGGKGSGRISGYSLEIAEKICDLIGEGKSLVKICRKRGMPPYRTVMSWIAAHTEFILLYTGALDDRVMTLREEILEIADRKGLDPKQKRVMIDARIKLMGWQAPTKYGDITRLELSGEMGVRELSDEEVDKRLVVLEAERIASGGR